jgi:hypothetical protein
MILTFTSDGLFQPENSDLRQEPDQRREEKQRAGNAFSVLNRPSGKPPKAKSSQDEDCEKKSHRILSDG